MKFVINAQTLAKLLPIQFTSNIKHNENELTFPKGEHFSIQFMDSENQR
jgi:hypothetical protein